jgi:hypothetical protein
MMVKDYPKDKTSRETRATSPHLDDGEPRAVEGLLREGLDDRWQHAKGANNEHNEDGRDAQVLVLSRHEGVENDTEHMAATAEMTFFYNLH